MKKVLALLLAAATLLSLAACGADSDKDDSSSDALSSSAVSSSDTSSDSGSYLASSSAASSSEAALSSAQSSSSAVSSSKSSSKSSSSASSSVTKNPEGEEILGQGSKKDPYLETPGEDMTVTTVKIPAGKELYYDIYRVGGKQLTINSSKAYVIYDGKKYTASNGKVTFKVGPALASAPVSFRIGNTGSSAASFKIVFSDLVGSLQNPKALSTLDGSTVSVSIEEGNEQGYCYKYVAEKDGIIRFYLKNSLDEAILMASRNKISGDMIIPVVKTLKKDNEEVKSDSSGNYVELEVLKGEEIDICVSAYPDGRDYPAVKVKWFAKYV